MSSPTRQKRGREVTPYRLVSTAHARWLSGSEPMRLKCLLNSACLVHVPIVTVLFQNDRRPWRFFYLFKLLNRVKIFSGTANEPLARSICKSIGMELGKCTVKPFPDGETFVKVEENVRGEEVFVVQPTSPPTNHNLMELFIMMDALRRASAKRVTAVMPFYGYARQDRK